MQNARTLHDATLFFVTAWIKLDFQRQFGHCVNTAILLGQEQVVRTTQFRRRRALS